MAAHDGFGLVNDTPAEIKRGRGVSPYLSVLELLQMEAVLRPSQALLANNKQDITGADNHYTI